MILKLFGFIFLCFWFSINTYALLTCGTYCSTIFVKIDQKETVYHLCPVGTLYVPHAQKCLAGKEIKNCPCIPPDIRHPATLFDKDMIQKYFFTKVEENAYKVIDCITQLTNQPPIDNDHCDNGENSGVECSLFYSKQCGKFPPQPCDPWTNYDSGKKKCLYNKSLCCTSGNFLFNHFAKESITFAIKIIPFVMAINECPSAFALPDIKKCRGCRRCKTTDIMIQGENHPSINRYVTNDDCSILVATCMQKGSAVLKFNEGGPIDGKYFPEAASNEPKRVIFDCEEEGWVFKSSDSINAKVTKLECIEAKLENHNSCNDCKSENLRAPGINSIYVTTILGYDGCLMALFQCPPNENVLFQVNKESGVYGRVFQSPSTEVTLKCLNQKWMHGTAEIHDLACTTPNV